MTKIFWLFLFALISITPVNAQKTFSLQGMIGGLQEEYIYLYKYDGETKEFIDSVKTKNGEFKFEAPCKQAFIAEFKIAGRRAGRVFLSPSQMSLFVHKKDMNHKFLIGKLKGSPAQNRYEDFQAKLAENNKQKLKIAENLEIPEIQSDSVKKNQFMKEYARLNKFKDEYFYKYASSPVVAYLIYEEYFAAKRSLEYVKEQLKTLKLANPNGLYVNNLQKRVNIIETLKNKGQFPEIKSKTLDGKEYQLSQHKGKPILLYIWRCWFPDRAQQYYDGVKDITSSFPSLEVVNIIRYSSYARVRIPGTTETKAWHPEPRPELNCIEIGSLNQNIEVVRYLDRGFNAFLLDKDGKIIYHQNSLNIELLKSQVSSHLSKL
ncbi:DUF4369 domain-containing protein [Marinifilum flexuosum]|uniref:Uncharacterized protein DUF4369 n=1 Tax=Marinifilum flexuosum TaxID=1117708 RepID=A0A419X7T9_9BACT|nr:DUF4369 domain-containing protein [Marinifilum flexuosum]RKE03679.1 uncharacterized protein DUF4369 [Marinifilum flexuosum]